MRRRLACAAGWLLVACYLGWLASPSQASWPSLSGRGSVFGNDPVQGAHDASDSGRTATGTPTTRGGIAVMRYSTLGGWWWVCAPRAILRSGATRCHLLKQTDIGPATWTGRIIDLTATTARRAWGMRVRGFPTDQGTWTLRYRGKRR